MSSHTPSLILFFFCFVLLFNYINICEYQSVLNIMNYIFWGIRQLWKGRLVCRIGIHKHSTSKNWQKLLKEWVDTWHMFWGFSMKHSPLQWIGREALGLDLQREGNLQCLSRNPTRLNHKPQWHHQLPQRPYTKTAGHLRKAKTKVEEI